MIVTDKKYFMEKRLIGKLDLMCNRCTGKRKLDNLILVDGDEGYGKTNIMIAMAYYMAKKTGRTFDLSNIFFDPDKMVNFAITHENCIIAWDEAAYGGLAIDWHNKFQKKLVKMLMVARKKRHIYFICIPKFFKLNEYLVVDRSVCLVHVYARDESKLGRFVYYKKKSKERLYYDWRKTKQRNYKKYYTLRGSFREVLPLIIDEEAYDKEKDEAMLGLLDVEELDKRSEKTIKIQYGFATFPHGTKKEKAEHLGVDVRSIYDWLKLPEKYDFLKENNRKWV